MGQCSSPYFRNDSGFKANVIPNTLNIRACVCVCVCVCARVRACMRARVCVFFLDVSKSLNVVVLIGTRSGVLIENWRLKSKPCWQYSIYQLNISVFVMHSPVMSGFLFLMLKKNYVQML